MKRYGHVIRLKPAEIDRYREVHAAVWPEVLEQIRQSNIKNYSIFLKLPEALLFAYYEYHGEDHDADMAAMAADPKTQEWWDLCKPMQEPLDTRADGEWWAEMEQVFFFDS